MAISGVRPNRDNDSYPDIEQKKREQARQDHDRAIGKRASSPSFAKTGPDRSRGKVETSNLNHVQSVEAGETLA